MIRLSKKWTHKKLNRSLTNVASVSSVFNDTRKVKVLSLPETIKEKSTFRAKALRRELLTRDEGPSLETSIFPLSFQVVRDEGKRLIRTRRLASD